MSRARVVATPWRPAATKEPISSRRRICVTLRLGIRRLCRLRAQRRSVLNPSPRQRLSSMLGARERRKSSIWVGDRSRAAVRAHRLRRRRRQCRLPSIGRRESPSMSRRVSPRHPSTIRARSDRLRHRRRETATSPLLRAPLRAALLPRPRAHRARSVRTIAKSRRASAPTIGRPPFARPAAIHRGQRVASRKCPKVAYVVERGDTRRVTHGYIGRVRATESPELCAAVRRSVIDTARGRYGGWRPGHCDRPAGRIAAHRLHRHSGGRIVHGANRRRPPVRRSGRRNADVCDVRDGPNTGRRRLEGLGRRRVYGDRYE